MKALISKLTAIHFYKRQNWNDGVSKYLVQERKNNKTQREREAKKKKKRKELDLKEGAGGFGAVIWLRFTLHKNKAGCFLQMKVQLSASENAYQIRLPAPLFSFLFFLKALYSKQGKNCLHFE